MNDISRQHLPGFRHYGLGSCAAADERHNDIKAVHYWFQINFASPWPQANLNEVETRSKAICKVLKGIFCLLFVRNEKEWNSFIHQYWEGWTIEAKMIDFPLAVKRPFCDDIYSLVLFLMYSLVLSKVDSMQLAMLWTKKNHASSESGGIQNFHKHTNCNFQSDLLDPWISRWLRSAGYTHQSFSKRKLRSIDWRLDIPIMTR